MIIEWLECQVGVLLWRYPISRGYCLVRLVYTQGFAANNASIGITFVVNVFSRYLFAPKLAHIEGARKNTDC